MEIHKDKQDFIESAIKAPVIPSKFKWLIVLCAALLTGAAWRIRGDSGFGGMMGMVVVGMFLNGVILTLWGDRKHNGFLMYGWLVLLIAVTANGLGTLNGQITGVLARNKADGLANYDIRVSPLSGAFLIFSVGFGWVPLWAMVISQYFSSKKYSSRDTIINFLIYAGGLFFADLILSHLIIPFIAPEAYKLFADAVVDLNMNPWSAYLSHYHNSDWYETIAGGRNYTAMVSNLSSCIGTLFLIFWVKIKHDDTKAASTILMLSLIFGFSITISDLWIYWDRGCYGGDSCTIPAPDWVHGWSLWEFFTGFFGGGLSLLYLLYKYDNYNIKDMPSLDSEISSDMQDDRNINDTGHVSLVPEKLEGILTFLLSYILIFWVSWLSALPDRLGRAFEWFDSDTNSVIFRAVILISAIIIGMWEFQKRKNIVTGDFKRTNVLKILIWAVITFEMIYLIPARQVFYVHDYLTLIGGFVGLVMFIYIYIKIQNLKTIADKCS